MMSHARRSPRTRCAIRIRADANVEGPPASADDTTAGGRRRLGGGPRAIAELKDNTAFRVDGL